jgi:hypothetical protein
MKIGKHPIRESIAPKLMEKILDLVLESGANSQEAKCALEAALAMLPELGIAFMTIDS